MKFADIEGNVWAEAQPGLAGKCRDCGQLVFAKCGQLRMRHWAHLKSKACDPWWETETEWHRSWKNQFPVARQEIGHSAQSGERHRVDRALCDGTGLSRDAGA
jgi:competence protein CoiA